MTYEVRRMKKILGLVIVGALVLLSFFLVRYLGLFQAVVSKGESVFVSEQKNKVMVEMGSEEEEGGDTLLHLQIEEVARGLDTPWAIVFTAPDRMLVSERPGRIRVIEKGQLLPEPLYSFPEISEKGEEGLLSLALDPNYPNTGFLYAILAYQKNGTIVDKVMRFRDTGSALVDPAILLDDIPAARFHAGARIAFGPDGKLYISTGDATDKNLAQYMSSLAGKVLRLNPDGSIPTDNPFPGSPVFTLGHRNPQGLAWHPDTGILYETEHGPSGFDGPGGGDEVNLLLPGKNYGWPKVSHEKSAPEFESPLVVFTPAEAPASLLIYSGGAIPAWRGQLFFGALKGEGLMRIVLDEDNPKRVESYEKLQEVDFGRIREVTEGPDGLIYFTTSNRDGRGNPRDGDDRIFRIRSRE